MDIGEADANQQLFNLQIEETYTVRRSTSPGSGGIMLVSFALTAYQIQNLYIGLHELNCCVHVIGREIMKAILYTEHRDKLDQESKKHL